MSDVKHKAKVLTVSDGVIAGTREDKSGVELTRYLTDLSLIHI